MKFCILFKGKFTRKQCGFSYARRRHTGSVSAHYALQLCCCRCCCLWRLAFDSPPVTPCVIDKILHPWLDDRLFRLACAFSKGRLTRLVTPAKHNSTGSLCNLLVAFQNVPCEAIFFFPRSRLDQLDWWPFCSSNSARWLYCHYGINPVSWDCEACCIVLFRRQCVFSLRWAMACFHSCPRGATIPAIKYEEV